MVDRDREPLIWEAISLSHDGLFLSPLLSQAFQDKCIRRAIIFLSRSKYHTTMQLTVSIIVEITGIRAQARREATKLVSNCSVVLARFAAFIWLLQLGGT